MKKKATVLVIFLVMPILVFGGDFSFGAKAIDTYPDLLFGLLPTFVIPGMNYSGLSIVDGIRTDIYLFGGGGFTRNRLWIDADGYPIDPDSTDISSALFLDNQAYDRWEIDFTLGLKQGIMQNPERERPTLAVYSHYEIHWESPQEDDSTSYFFSGAETMFPDQNGVAANSLTFGAMFDLLDKGAVPKGIIADVSLLAAPGLFANNLRGTSDFYWILGVVEGYLPLWQLKQDSGLNLVGIYLSDRLQADAIWGGAVAQDYKIDPALGTKTRGFEKNSIGTTITLVNNFDVRVAGPEIFLKNLYPRFHIFFDMGFYGGHYHNSDALGSGFISSTGFEIVATLLDILNLGYRGSIILAGQNMAQKTYYGEFMVALQY